MNLIPCVHFFIITIFVGWTTSALATTHPLEPMLLEHHKELDEKLGWKEKAVLWVTARKLKNSPKSKDKEPKEPKEFDRMAIHAFPLGLLSFLAVAVIFPLNALLSLVAIYLGFLSLSRIRKFGRKGKFLAILGIVFGIAGLLTSAYFSYILYMALFV